MSAQTPPLLAADDLCVGYAATRIAAHISFSLEAGDVLCLLGPNGAGKTTLFKTLLGLTPPLAGSVRLGGTALSALDRRAIARFAAYVPQAHGTEFAYSVLDLVLMGRTAHLGAFAQPTQTDRARAHTALGALGIGELAGADSTRISGGQRQLVLIARALAQDARLMIMDEPTASLDLANAARVLAEVRRLAQAGFAVVLSTHDPDQALNMASRVGVIAAGGLLSCGPVDTALTAEVLSRAYGIPVAIERTPSGRRVVSPQIGPNSMSVPCRSAT